MNRYECKKCSAKRPCIFEQDAGPEPPNSCPYKFQVPVWIKIDKPPTGPDEIVKLADKLLYEHSLEGSRKALRPVFQALEAEIGKLREDYKCLCQAEQDHAKRLGGTEDSWLKTEIEGLKKKFKDLLDWTEDLSKENRALRKLFRNHESRIAGLQSIGPVLDQQILDLDADTTNLERKVEALGSDLCRHMYPILTPQPSAEGGIAQALHSSGQAPDEKGDMHDLIPGRSVVWSNHLEREGLFLGIGEYEKHVLYAPGLTQGEYGPGLWTTHSGGFSWRRDLDFPATNPAGKPGGDK